MTGNYLKKFRSNRKWSQKKCSEEFGVKQQRFSEWENGKSKIPLYVEKIVMYIEKCETLSDQLKKTMKSTKNT